ncbi:hypothetical protein BGZ46_005612, partial [Entomortierella lignicola]
SFLRLPSMTKAKPFSGFKDLPKENDMDCESGASPLNAFNYPAGQQQISVTATPETDVVPEPIFTLVERQQQRHLMMIPMAAFNIRKPKLPMMIDAIKDILAKTATIVGAPRIEYLINDQDASEGHVIFQVGTSDQLQLACQSGFSYEDEEGKSRKTYFREYTASLLTAQQNRIVQMNSIALTTKANDIHAAMALWGAISSVTMGFNSTKSMATAKVTFAQSSSVDKMLEENVTSVVIGRDTAVITQLGTRSIAINRDLTMKLVNIPRWYAPRDSPNAEASFHSVTMPFNVHTRRRHPVAFVSFTNLSQWERVRHIVFQIEGKNTAWVNPKQPTCHHCGSPEHLKQACPVLKQRMMLQSYRKANTAAMQNPTRTPPRMMVPNSQPTPSPARSVSQHSSTANTQRPALTSAKKGQQGQVHFTKSYSDATKGQQLGKSNAVDK